MQNVKTIEEIKKFRKQISGSIGFVPTMGYLHEGHLSLVRLAKKENDFVIVSIFVNPKQFGPGEDFVKYPRDTEKDLEMLKSVWVDAVFLPTPDEIYPPGFETYVTVSKLSKILEGAKRPGHFDGVCTIISKLFNIILPTRMYFGQKDAQQIAVIKKMVYDLQIPVAIKTGDTVREENGLAMSSRNVFLSKSEKDNAASLYQSLKLAQNLFDNGERKSENIKQEMTKRIVQSNGKIDYISIADPQTLDELPVINKTALVNMAVYFGKTRLIDNLILQE